MTGLIIPIAVFIGVAALVGGVAMLLPGTSESGVEDRLAILTGSSSGKQAKDALLKGSVLAHPLENGQHAAVEPPLALG